MVKETKDESYHPTTIELKSHFDTTIRSRAAGHVSEKPQTFQTTVVQKLLIFKLSSLESFDKQVKNY